MRAIRQVPSQTRPYNPGMQKFSLLICVILAVASSEVQAQEIAWMLRAPAAGVKEGDTARIELIAINGLETAQQLVAHDALIGDIGDAGEKMKIELKRVGDAPKFVPGGGFIAIPYEMIVPRGVGEHVVRVRSPIEASTVLRVLPATPVPHVTATTPATTPAPTTKVVVAPEPLSIAATASRVPTTSESGVVEFVKNKLSPHERMYFLVGNEDPTAKFQISFKYQIFNEQSNLVAEHPWVNGFYLGYTQTSFWDLAEDSAPFFDSTYRPEVFWSTNDIRIAAAPDLFRFDFQTGIQHESNGKSGADSRTINSIYLRPAFTFGDKDAFFVTFAPKAYIYISSLADNPDITDYRGYFDLNFIVGQGDGLQAAFTGRIGDDWDKGSLQVDISYPLRKIIFNALDVYLHAQAYTGYGESLLRYNENDSTFRIGLSLVR